MESQDKILAAFKAIARSAFLEIGELVAQLPEGANTKDKNGRSLLAAAIVARKTPMMLRLCQLGADANGTTERDEVPLLLFAIRSGVPGGGGIETVELLIQHDADIRVANRRGMSALHVCADVGPMSLYSAYMSRYMIGAGAEVNARDDRGRSPLHIAVTTIARGTVRLLCEHGADTAAIDSEGKTPLDHVRAQPISEDGYSTHVRDEYIRLLLEHGAGSSIH